MDRKEMVNAIYNIEKLYVDLMSREEWQKLAEMTDEEIFAEGFDEVDPYGEYLIIRTLDDRFSTFRNSYVDMFYR
mgnify:CR=1 FL=1